MSKNAEGWIRHRGGECPVGEGVKVDYRMRDGDVDDFGRDAVRLKWNHIGGCADIMAYRLHKPAEQVEPFLEDVQAFNALAKVPQLDGPIGWRDRIAEIDATTQALTAERAELVQKLASEGFALIGRVVEPVEDMSDWRNWKVGDCARLIDKVCEETGMEPGSVGEITRIDEHDKGGHHVKIDDHYWPLTKNLIWHSRPSA